MYVHRQILDVCVENEVGSVRWVCSNSLVWEGIVQTLLSFSDCWCKILLLYA